MKPNIKPMPNPYKYKLKAPLTIHTLPKYTEKKSVGGLPKIISHSCNKNKIVTNPNLTITSLATLTTI